MPSTKMVPSTTLERTTGIPERRCYHGQAPASTTGLQRLPALRLRVVLDRDSSRRSHRSHAGKTRATLILEGNAA